MNKPRLFGVCIFLLLALMGWLIWKKSWQEALGAAGGGALGIVSYVMLERAVASIGATVRFLSVKIGLGMLALGGGAVLLAFLPGSVYHVLLGYSCFVASLLVNTVWEAVYA
jgi:hypothetical protein